MNQTAPKPTIGTHIKASPLKLANPVRLPALDVLVVARSPTVIDVMRAVQKNPACRRMTWRYTKSGLADAKTIDSDSRVSDLLIIENDVASEQVVSHLQALAAITDPKTRVILLNPYARPDLRTIRDVFKLGISEVLLPPLSESDVLETLHEVGRDIGIGRLGQVTAFMGARGGDGSSAVALNVAVALSLFSKSEVILADCDQQHGTVALNFDMQDAYTVTDVIRRRSPIDDVLMERLLTNVNDQLRLLLVDPGIENPAHLPAHAVNVILDLANKKDRHLLLDMPSTWNSRTRKILEQVDQVVVTAEPTLASLQSAAGLVRMLRFALRDDKNIALVLNKCGRNKRNSVTAAMFAETLEMDTTRIFEVANDPAAFVQAQLSGQSLIQSHEGHAASQQIIELARHINSSLEYGASLPLGRRMIETLRKWW